MGKSGALDTFKTSINLPRVGLSLHTTQLDVSNASNQIILV